VGRRRVLAADPGGPHRWFFQQGRRTIQERRTNEARSDEHKLVPFHIASVVFGFSPFLYLPIRDSGGLLLQRIPVGHRLVLDFSTKWYGELFQHQAPDGCCWVTVPGGFRLGEHAHCCWGTFCAHMALGPATRASWAHPVFPAWFSRRLVICLKVITRLFAVFRCFSSLPWIIRFAVSGQLLLAHITFTMCFVAVVVQSRLMSFRSLARGGGDGSWRRPGPPLMQITPAG